MTNLECHNVIFMCSSLPFYFISSGSHNHRLRILFWIINRKNCKLFSHLVIALNNPFHYSLISPTCKTKYDQRKGLIDIEKTRLRFRLSTLTRPLTNIIWLLTQPMIYTKNIDFAYLVIKKNLSHQSCHNWKYTFKNILNDLRKVDSYYQYNHFLPIFQSLSATSLSPELNCPLCCSCQQPDSVDDEPQNSLK